MPAATIIHDPDWCGRELPFDRIVWNVMYSRGGMFKIAIYLLNEPPHFLILNDVAVHFQEVGCLSQSESHLSGTSSTDTVVGRENRMIIIPWEFQAVGAI